MVIKRIKSRLHTVLNVLVWPLRRLVFFLESRSDQQYLSDNVPTPSQVGHSQWQKHLYALGNKPGMRVLEVGSREVTGRSRAREEFSAADYVGFDYYDGPNVDVVGDAHKLSTYFDEGEQFDIIFSSACFEHFAMPWVVAAEISKLLKVGGLVFAETHFSFSSHERPWHFFHFTDLALRVLFNEQLGIECVEAGMSNPLVGRFSSLADEYLRNQPVGGLYCHSEFLGKKVRDVNDITWDELSMDDVVGTSKYPAPK